MRTGFFHVYCVNPDCQQRLNSPNQEHCQFCGTSLTILERYSLLAPLRPLDFPSSTEIFEIEDRQRGHKIMKVLKSNVPRLVEALDREATVLQILRHPGIPEVDEGGYFTLTPNASSRVLHCLVMEKFAGPTLQEWLTTSDGISQSLAIDWLRQMTLILDCIHGANFFHQDIKPANIILRPDGSLGLIDFGAVGVMDDIRLAAVSSGFGSDDTTDITLVGTVGYVAPEQANGKAVPQSDFFALGRTFIHLITGTAPHRLPTDPRTGALLWRNQASQIRKKLADLIDELVAVFPGDRPKNSQILLRSMERLQNQRRWLRSPVFWASATLGLVLFAFGSYRTIPFLVSRYYVEQGLKLQAQEPQLAGEYFQRAIKLTPADVGAYTGLAVSCQILENVSCAITNYQKALQLEPNAWETHYDLGTLYDNQGDYAAAEQQYRLSMHQMGLFVDALNNIARIKNLQGAYPTAERLTQQGLKQTHDPISRSALYKNLGWAYLGLRQYPEANVQLLQARKLDPQRADVYCLLAKVQEAQNNLSGAKEYWRNCLRYDSELPEVKKWRDDVLQRLLKR